MIQLGRLVSGTPSKSGITDKRHHAWFLYVHSCGCELGFSYVCGRHFSYQAIAWPQFLTLCISYQIIMSNQLSDEHYGEGLLALNYIKKSRKSNFPTMNWGFIRDIISTLVPFAWAL